ncbi:MAG: hypothetical protein ACRD2X_16305 [Vicinamibacteraceae bacterium]
MAKKATRTRNARKGAAARKRPVKAASKAKSAGQRKRSKRAAAGARKRQGKAPSLKSIVDALDAYIAARQARSATRARGVAAGVQAQVADGEWEAKLGRARVEMKMACESIPAFG